MSIRKSAFLIVVLFIIIFSNIMGISKTMLIELSDIKKEQIIVAGESWYNSFIIKFSNIIYEVKGKSIKIPIFQGTEGDVLYKDFREFCLINKYLEPRVRESGFVVKCKKGEVKKTFVEFINFYRSNILKDVNFDDKSNFDVNESGWTIFYKFKIDGVSCVLNIEIDAAKRIDRKKLKTVYDIMVNEDMAYPSFAYSFDINSEVTPW
jgi:hypothetical protein